MPLTARMKSFPGSKVSVLFCPFFLFFQVKMAEKTTKDKKEHKCALIFVTHYTVTARKDNYLCSLIILYLHMYNKLKHENFRVSFRNCISKLFLSKSTSCSNRNNKIFLFYA